MVKLVGWLAVGFGLCGWGGAGSEGVVKGLWLRGLRGGLSRGGLLRGGLVAKGGLRVRAPATSEVAPQGFCDRALRARDRALCFGVFQLLRDSLLISAHFE